MLGSYTLILEKPDLSFREADQFASLMFNYQRRRFNANLFATWFDEREMSTDNSDSIRLSLNDYWLLSGKASYNLSSKWQLFAQVKNLLNEEYRTPTSSALLTEGVPNRGQELLVGMTVSF